MLQLKKKKRKKMGPLWSSIPGSVTFKAHVFNLRLEENKGSLTNPGVGCG